MATMVWDEDWDSELRTEAQILQMDLHLDVYMAVMSSQPMRGRFPDTTVQITSEAAPNDFFKTGGMFIVSERLKTMLENFDVNCEFFRLSIVDNSGRPIDKACYFCNILDCVECLDLTKGQYSFYNTPGFTDHVDKITALRIDEAKVGSYDLFRVAKGGEHIVCVSERLVRGVNECRLTGMRFLSQEKYCG